MPISYNRMFFHATSTAQLAKTLVTSGIVGGEGGLKSFLGHSFTLARYKLTTGRELEQAYLTCPDKIALIDDEGLLSYRQLRDRSRTFARYLRRHHGDDIRLGIMARNGRGIITPLGAKGYSGGAVYLLNVGSSPEQLRGILLENNINVLVIDQEFSDRLPSNYPQELDIIIADHKGQTEHQTLEKIVLNPQRYANQKLPFWPKHGPIVLMSSGTTGIPKGIMRNEPTFPYILNSALTAMPWRADQRIHLTASIFHTWGWACLNVALSAHNTVITRRNFDPQQCLEDLERYRPDGLISSPVFFKRMVEIDPEGTYNTSSLKFIASSGHALDPHLVAQVHARFGNILTNFYGSTEVSLASVATPEQLAKDASSSGSVACGTRLEILDENRNPVPAGTTGEIFVHNSMTLTKYTRPDLEVERVDGMIPIGDYGYLDNQETLHVLGRTDDMIIVGGENVHPQSVSSCLESMPGVREVYAGGVKDLETFERIAVWVVRTNDTAGKELTAEAIREYVRTQLADHSIPRDVHFLEELPRNATGKVVPRLL